MVAGALSRLGFDVVEKHDVGRATGSQPPAMIAGGGKPGLPPENARLIRCSHVLEINFLNCQQVENRGDFR